MNAFRFFLYTSVLLSLQPAAPRLFGAQGGTGEPTTSSGSATVSIEVEPLTARVAEPIVVTVRVEAPTGSTIKLPEFQERLGDFELLERFSLGGVPIARDSARWRRWEYQFVVESLLSGEMKVPPFEVSCVIDGQSKLIATEPLSVTVTSELTEPIADQKIREADQPLDAPAVEEESRLGLAAGIGVGVFVLLLAGFAMAWRKRTPPAIRVARQHLEELDRQRETLSPATFHSQAVAILRDYLQATFSHPITAMSADEVESAFDEGGLLPESIASRTVAFLRRYDETRFAGTDLISPADASDQLRSLLSEIDSAATCTESR